MSVQIIYQTVRNIFDIRSTCSHMMDKEKILAFVTVHGSTNSHTAILARMMNIPALVGVPVDLERIHNGMTAVVDGFSAEVLHRLPSLPYRTDCQAVPWPVR